jgi:SEC-C motif
VTILTAPALPAYGEDELGALSHAALIDLLIRDEDRVPCNVIDHCASRGNAMLALLHAKIEDDDSGLAEPVLGEWWLVLHAAMIAGLIPSESAGLFLVRLMRRIDETEDDDMQDWLAGAWPWFFFNKSPSTIEAVRRLNEDAELDWYTRCTAAEIIVARAARENPAALDRELDTLAERLADKNEDWDLRIAGGNLLLGFPRERHRGLFADLGAEQQFPFIDFSDEGVALAFARGHDLGDWERMGEPWKFYAPGVIAARQDRWEQEDMAAGEGILESADDYFDPVPLPYVRGTEKVGRNDPCPCGSGKKYKKCCLPKEEA